MRTDILNNKDLILELISNKASKQTICNALNCKHSTLDSYLKKMGIEYKGNCGRKGLAHIESYKDSSNYLHKGSNIQSHKLKIKLIKDGIFQHECSNCTLTEWQGNKIPLELDHIDGDPFNNELINIRLLCPNCHALTDTYRAKNKRTVRDKKELDLIVKELKVKNTKICEHCNIEYSQVKNLGKGKQFCSEPCYKKSIEKFSISEDELRELVWKYPTTQVAKLYNVSDKAIDKRCKKLNIEKPPRGYWMKNKGT